MLADLSTRNRQIAIGRIIAIRNASDTSEQTLRTFQVPKISQEAMQLIDLLPSMGDCTTEPPLLKDFSKEELQKFAENPLLVRVPCHSQAVERCTKLVSEASKQVYGKESRDGYVKATIKSRKIMPAYKSK